jgi:coniferyl-aldehyde dehydrogenase
MSQGGVMVADSNPVPATAGREALRAAFEGQRAAFRAHPFPALGERLGHLDRLSQALRTHTDAIVDSVSADFGHRSAFESRSAELLVAVRTIGYVRKRLRRWMRRSSRRPGILFATTQAWVEYQPKGVVGVLSPWNYPLQLAVVPLVYALAAGNRVMLKPSELTPKTSALLGELVREAFPPELVTVVQGGPELARAFSDLPFDHLLFTGSTRVGRQVMRAAADNLTPVTLELGGKSPVIISQTANLAESASRICFGKSLNAGQTCVAPDYVLCPPAMIEPLLEAMRESFARMYGRVTDNQDYTSIAHGRHYDRLHGMLEEARAAGARVVSLSDETPDAEDRRMSLTAVVDPPLDSALMREEIFGPILPVIPCESFDGALAFIGSRPHPLALHYFGRDRAERQRVLHESHAGSVCVNDAVFQAAVDDLPFGGVGESGIGHYHGEEGFRTFSHAKSVFVRPSFLNLARVFHPPYGTRLQQLIMRLFHR